MSDEEDINEYGIENQFINPNLVDKYLDHCKTKALQMTIQYKTIPYIILLEIISAGFDIGLLFASELYDQETLKESYL